MKQNSKIHYSPREKKPVIIRIIIKHDDYVFTQHALTCKMPRVGGAHNEKVLDLSDHFQSWTKLIAYGNNQLQQSMSWI